MSISTLSTPSAPIGNDGDMNSPHPRADGPHQEPCLHPDQKLAHLTAYEEACRQQQGGAYLPRGPVFPR